MLRLLFIYCLLCMAWPSYAQSGDAKFNEQVQAYRALALHDARLADVGYNISLSNAKFCPNVAPQLGWVLHDIAQYPDAALARAAFKFNSPISVLHVVKNAPAYEAGVRAGDGFIGISYEDAEAIIRTSPVEESDKSNDFTRMARTTAHIGHALNRIAARKTEQLAQISIMRDGEILSLPFDLKSACFSDYILDASDRLNAGANGRHVRVTQGLSLFTPDDNEFAVLVAHELAHNILEHRKRLEAAKRGSGPLAKLGRNKRIKTIEEEADRLSVWLMANAGYDINAAISFHQRLGTRKGRPFLGSLTHNKWKKRVAFVQQEIAEIQRMKTKQIGLLAPPMLNNFGQMPL